MNKELRTLMEAARKGPFRHNKDNGQIGDVCFANGLTHLQIQSLWVGDSKARDDSATYIAALLNAAPDLVDRIEQATQPDCRTCKSFYVTDYMNIKKRCDHGGCTDGDKYEPAPKVVLWGTKS